MVRIGINASFARKGNTGIGQVTLNFLKKLSEVKSEKEKVKNDEFILYLEEDINLKLPSNFKKRIFLPTWRRDDLIRKIWWEKFLLPKKVREDKCDFFFSLYQSTTLLSNKVNPHTKNFGEGVKHIMLVHDIIPKLFPEYLNNWRKRLYWKLTERAIKSADKIIAVSKRTEKDLIQHLGINPAKITVSYVDVDEIYKHAVSAEKSRKIMEKYDLAPGYIYTGGGLEKRKNTENLIRAYKMLLERNKKEHFVHDFPEMVVSGKLLPQLAPLVLDIEKLVRELNLTEHVRVLDFVPQADLPALYKNAQIFVYPSLYEGFGLPVLEAMSQGTPVITSKTTSLPEVGRDSVLYCDPTDIQDIAMTIKNALVNKKLQITLSVRGKGRAQNFSWERFVKKIINIVNERDN
ncbi:MAG: glycosyltransferase family 1 protein [Patescibacteria group bacterium]